MGEEEKSFGDKGGCAEAAEAWEKRLDGESPMAFRAFCLFRDMGYRRSIKGCLELHGIEARKYGSWSRYARLFDWKGRAAAFDEHVARESEKEILCERAERKKRQMRMLDGFDELVQKRIRTLDPEELDADGAMDLLERSAKLDALITGADRETEKKDDGGLFINFVEDFKKL